MFALPLPLIAAMIMALCAAQAPAAIYRATTVGTVLGDTSTLEGSAIADATALRVDVLFDASTDANPAPSGGRFAALSATLTLDGDSFQALSDDLMVLIFRFDGFTGMGITNAAGNRGFADYFRDDIGGFDVNAPTGLAFSRPASRNSAWPLLVPTVDRGAFVLTGYTPETVSFAAVPAPVPLPASAPVLMGAMTVLAMLARQCAARRAAQSVA